MKAKKKKKREKEEEIWYVYTWRSVRHDCLWNVFSNHPGK